MVLSLQLDSLTAAAAASASAAASAAAWFQSAFLFSLTNSQVLEMRDYESTLAGGE